MVAGWEKRQAENQVALVESEVIASHRRRMGRDQTITDPQHYLGILERKPGALRNGVPFQDLPRPIALVPLVNGESGQDQHGHRNYEYPQGKGGGDRAFVEVLRVAREHGQNPWVGC